MRLLPLVAAAPLVVASLANAVGPQRTFVSTTGSDANAAANCSLPTPCRSFDTAIGVVAPGGEVIALDSGGYGRFTVTKSVTVAAPAGVYAAISVFSGTDGVDINTAGVDVVLRGLAISGQGGTHGIYFQNGATLVVDNCTINGMNSDGVRASAPGSDNNHPAKVQIIGSTITKNNIGVELLDGPIAVTLTRTAVTANVHGITAQSGLAGVENAVTVQASTLSNSTFGAGLLASSQASGSVIVAVVSDSTISANVDNGVYVSGSPGATSLVTLSGNTITENYNGVSVSGSGTLKAVVGENTIARNRSYGLWIGGTVLSRGDNTITDNIFGDTTSPSGSISGL